MKNTKNTELCVFLFVYGYYYTCDSVCITCVCILGARGEPEGATTIAGEGEQRGATAGDPQRSGPFHTPL